MKIPSRESLTHSPAKQRGFYLFLSFAKGIFPLLQRNPAQMTLVNGPCHVSGIFLPLWVNSLPLATIYEVKIPLRKWKKSLLQRNPAQMTLAIDWLERCASYFRLCYC
jgi:hypothetical protein